MLCRVAFPAPWFGCLVNLKGGWKGNMARENWWQGNGLLKFSFWLWPPALDADVKKEFSESNRLDKNKLTRLILSAQLLDLCSLNGHIYIPAIPVILLWHVPQRALDEIDQREICLNDYVLGVRVKIHIRYNVRLFGLWQKTAVGCGQGWWAWGVVLNCTLELRFRAVALLRD